MGQLPFRSKINVWPCSSKQRLSITVHLNSFMLRIAINCFHVSLFSRTLDLRFIFINTHEYRFWSFLILFIRPHIECLRTKAPNILSVLTKGFRVFHNIPHIEVWLVFHNIPQYSTLGVFHIIPHWTWAHWGLIVWTEAPQRVIVDNSPPRFGCVDKSPSTAFVDKSPSTLVKDTISGRTPH